ncbi:MAG: gamma-glutamylcyclotransferase family protein [Thermaerobacter sp.]
MSVRLFTYGTLKRRGRIEALAGERLGDPRPAVLHGYRKYDTEHGYPVILPEPGARVEGLLWELGPGALEAIDHYEGVDHDPPMYQRQQLKVLVDGREVEAYVYVGIAGAFAELRPADD